MFDQEYEPNQAMRVFYGKAIEIDQKRKLLKAAFDKGGKRLSNDGYTPRHYPGPIKAFQRMRYQGSRETDIAQRQITSELDPSLQPAAQTFFDILPAIIKAVASIQESNPRHVTDFIERPTNLTSDFCIALLIGAQGAHCTLTAQTTNEMVIASPHMAPDEVMPFPRDASNPIL